jgi:hypothetical protein
MEFWLGSARTFASLTVPHLRLLGFFFKNIKKTFLQQSPSQVAIYLNFEKRVSRVYMGTYLQRIDIKIILFLSCNTQKF